MRGSSLLMVGRFISLGLNFCVQLLIARYLSQTDYGAWAYALSFVTLGETVATLGLDRGISRFLAVYDEQRDNARLLGTLVFVMTVVGSIGLCLVLVVLGAQSWLTTSVVGDRQTVTLMVILVVLAPLQGADNLFGGALAVFASARAIFLRKHVLGPGLRLVVVLLLVLTAQDVEFLAAGYVVAGLVGLSLYVGILWRVLAARGVRSHLRLREIRVPAKEILGFTVPLLSTDLVYLSMTTTDAFLLQHFWGSQAVAEYRVVQPLANMNQVVFASFSLLFMPAAARLLVRDDRAGGAELYWRTAVWVAVFSFPMVALTTTMAGPVTVALYEPRYAGSAVYLAIVSMGIYLNAALGFNGLTLRVYGFVRYTLYVNLAVVLLNVVLNVLLISRLGPLGAAIATGTTLVVHNVLKQWGLRRRTNIDVFDRRYAPVYLVLIAGLGVLALLHWTFDPHLLASIALTGGVWLAILLLTRRLLDLHETFPELARVPLLGRLARR